MENFEFNILKRVSAKERNAILVFEAETRTQLYANSLALKLFCDSNTGKLEKWNEKLHLLKEKVFEGKNTIGEMSFWSGEEKFTFDKIEISIEEKRVVFVFVDCEEKDKKIILNPYPCFGYVSKSAIFIVKNADNLIAKYGYSIYKSSIISEIEETLETFHRSAKCYELNYKMFLFSFESQDKMDEIEAKIYEMMEKKIIETGEKKIPIIFEVVLSGGTLESIIKKVFEKIEYESEESVYSISSEDKQREVEVIKILKYVIENKKVIPYYQGIYDNRKKRIEKYEALMRVEGEDGKVYSPEVFLEIARRYNLYNTLNCLLIERVLEDFEKRNEIVSINLSEINMTCDEFANWFWETIKSFPNTGRMVLEILETEKIRDWNKVSDFVFKAKYMGMKIAIDDFGSGYSNLIHLLKLKPDMVKIDGDIIKNICEPYNMVVVKTIKFLASNIGAEVVAEYVENEMIQEIIEKERIRYSQGYYFEIPRSIGEFEKIGKR